MWSERRKADKTALVRLHGNVYQVDAWLAGRIVELLFDPFDLDRIEVRLGGKPAGTAVPFVMGRHRHPKTRTPDGQARTEPAPTGIDYLGALGDSHDQALRDRVSYQFLVPGQQEPGNREERETRKRRKEKAVADSPEETLALARTAAGAVRCLNHATLGCGRAGTARRRLRAHRRAGARRGRPAPAPGPGRPVARIRPRGRPISAATTAPAPPARSAAPGCSSPAPAATAAALARDLGCAQQQLAAVHGALERSRRRKGIALMIDAVVTRFGFARMPFGRDLPPSRLHRHHDLRRGRRPDRWAVSEKTIAMITGEVGHRQDRRDPLHRRRPRRRRAHRHLHRQLRHRGKGRCSTARRHGARRQARPRHRRARRPGLERPRRGSSRTGPDPGPGPGLYRPPVALSVSFTWACGADVLGSFTDLARDVVHVPRSARGAKWLGRS